MGPGLNPGGEPLEKRNPMEPRGGTRIVGLGLEGVDASAAVSPIS